MHLIVQVRHLPPIVAETLTAAPHARPVELLLAALVQVPGLRNDPQNIPVSSQA